MGFIIMENKDKIKETYKPKESNIKKLQLFLNKLNKNGK
jgi:hypothetical protein